MTTTVGRAGVRTAITSAVLAVVLAAGCSRTVSGSSHHAVPSAASSTQPPTATTGAPSASQPASASTSASPAATVPDPCTLLTLAEAKKLAGSTLAPGVDSPSPDPASPASCTYTAPPTAPSGQVELFVSLAVPRALLIDRAVKHKFVTVPGIADETIEEPENSNIFIRKGSLWVYLNIPFGATPATLQRGARLIASRMP